jgi:hypothetical protein
MPELAAASVPISRRMKGKAGVSETRIDVDPGSACGILDEVDFERRLVAMAETVLKTAPGAVSLRIALAGRVGLLLRPGGTRDP